MDLSDDILGTYSILLLLLLYILSRRSTEQNVKGFLMSENNRFTVLSVCHLQ